MLSWQIAALGSTENDRSRRKISKKANVPLDAFRWSHKLALFASRFQLVPALSPCEVWLTRTSWGERKLLCGSALSSFCWWIEIRKYTISTSKPPPCLLHVRECIDTSSRKIEYIFLVGTSKQLALLFLFSSLFQSELTHLRRKSVIYSQIANVDAKKIFKIKSRRKSSDDSKKHWKEEKKRSRRGSLKRTHTWPGDEDILWVRTESIFHEWKAKEWWQIGTGEEFISVSNSHAPRVKIPNFSYYITSRMNRRRSAVKALFCALIEYVSSSDLN